MIEAAPLPRSHGRDAWLQFKSHKGALFGCGFFVFILCFVMIGPVFWAVDPQFIDIQVRNSGMSLAHPLGTDQLGRDMLARLMIGGRTSVAVGIAAMMLSLFIGTLIGILAGFARRLDSPLMRLTDLFLALPLLPLLLVIILLFRDPASGGIRPGNGHLLSDRRGHRHHQLDANRQGRPRRGSYRQGARVRGGGEVHRHAGTPDCQAPYSAERSLADHGFGGPWHRQCHHHRIGIVVSRAWISVGLCNVGKSAVRCHGLSAAISEPGAVARLGDFAHRLVGQLHGRRAPRFARSTTTISPDLEKRWCFSNSTAGQRLYGTRTWELMAERFWFVDRGI